MVVVHASRRGCPGARVLVRGRGIRRADRRALRRRRRRPRSARRAGCMARHGRRRSAMSADRVSRRRRSRPSTPRSGISKRGCSTSPCAAAGHGPRRSTRVRQRRIHFVHRRATRGTARWLGSRHRHSPGEDEDRNRPGPPTGSRPRRVAIARDAIGSDAELFVDANGAYPPQAGYSPRPDVRGDGCHVVRGAGLLRRPRRAARDPRGDPSATSPPANTATTWPTSSACAHSGAVDVLQADVSRCAGITEWMRVAAVAAAHGLEISGHCAQSLHVAPGVPR